MTNHLHRPAHPVARSFAPLVAFLACGLVSVAARAQNDLPGFGGETLRPRLLVILDTSSSMRFNPGYSAEFPNDDFIESPRTTDAACRSKFCIGKRAMYDVLSSNASLVELGLAGYFQSTKTVNYPAVSTDYSIKCKYDVLATSGKFIDSSKQQWTASDDIAPTVADGVAFTCSPETQSGIIACAAGQPDHQCTKTTTLGSTDTVYQNPGCPANATAFNGTSTPCAPSATRTVSTQTYSYVASSSGWDASNYRNVIKTVPSAACSATPLLNITSGTSGCSTTKKCDFYLNTTVGSPAGTVWINSGTTHTRYNPLPSLPTTISSVTYTQLNSSSTNTGAYISKSGPADTCAATVNGYTGGFESGASVNCATAPGGCNLTAGSGAAPLPIVTAADTKTAYTSALAISGYTVNPTPTTTTAFSYTVSIATACQKTPGTTFSVTTSTYQGVSVGCGASTTAFGSNACVLRQDAETVSTDLGTRTCRFTRFTYTYTKPAVTTGYRCKYTLTTYVYGYQDAYCQYRRYNYVYRDTQFTYKWNTLGGEIIGTYTTGSITVPNGLVCGNSTAETTYCAPTLTGSSAPGSCKGTNIWGCKLRAQSRYSWSNPAATSSTTSTYCMASDLLNTVVPSMINPATTRADWCAMNSSGGSAAYSDPPVLVADYYDPGTANTPVANVTWDPPLPARKSYGLSFILTPTPITPATSFTGIGLNTASPGGPIIQMLQKYNATTNPKGMRMPAAADGPFTPLYGSLVNAKEYLQTLIDVDPDVACRSYYVLLVTDGDEDTPRGYGASDLVNAVTALRNMTKGSMKVDVNTFVVGFGVQSPTLDQMAVAGGRPQVEVGPPARVGAFDASDADRLNQQLNLILGQITSGVYSRTKPVFTNAGDRIYAGYFSHTEAGLEWPGFLDAYSVANGEISEDPIWKFNEELDSMTSNSRNLLTRVSGAVTLSPFATYSQAPAPKNCTLVDDITGGANCPAASRTASDATVNFIRNDLASRQTFANSLTPKSSRLSDIFHSTPAAIGAPFFSANWGITAREQLAYKSFRTVHQDREPTVFVGSNGGVVHAIRDFPGVDAPSDYTPGTERWGYVPNQLLSKLADSRNSHRFLVDGNFAISDVCAGSTCEDLDGTGWKTILVGTLGRGGAGVFALNVTDPATPVHLWEQANEPNMGETWSGPVVGRVRVASSSPFGVFIGGGFSSTNGKGDSFYVFDALDGSILYDGTTAAKWTIPSLNRSGVKNNVPSRPRLIRPGDGSLTSVVYFGDTDGKVLRMSTSSNRIADWSPQVMFNPFNQPNCPATPLTALPDAPVTTVTLPLPLPASDQPFPQIFNRAVIGDDDGAAGTGRRLLYFGTGDVNNPSDTTTQDYFYAVRDDSDVIPVPTCRAPALWGKRLPMGGKVLGDPVIIGRNVILSVYRPPTASATCGASGQSTLYCFDKVTGAEVSCLTPQPTLADPTPANTSYLQVGSVGIVSDLTVVGSTLIFNASNDPNQIRSVGVNSGAVPFQVRTWKRVK